MEEEKALIRNSDIVTREEEGEALLFNPQDGNLFCVNGTGSFIWNCCDGSSDEKEIVRKLSQEFEISDLDKARQDAKNFISQLKEHGFIGYKI